MFSGLIQSPKQDRDCTWWGKLFKNILLFLTAFRSTCYSFLFCPSQLWFSRMPQLLATSFTIRSQSTLRNGQEHFCSERGWEDWSQGVCCNLVGEIHYQHAERKIRGDLILFQNLKKKYLYCDIEVAFYIFTNGRQTLGLNLTERFSITDNALENMPWPDMDVYDATKMFKSKLRFQIRHGDFRQRISQDEEDIQSILNWWEVIQACHWSEPLKLNTPLIGWRPTWNMFFSGTILRMESSSTISHKTSGEQTTALCGGERE